MEGPTKKLTFLGIEVDAEALILRLPEEKLVALRSLLTSWKGRRWCLKSDLQASSSMHAKWRAQGDHFCGRCLS